MISPVHAYKKSIYPVGVQIDLFTALSMYPVPKFMLKLPVPVARLYGVDHTPFDILYR